MYEKLQEGEREVKEMSFSSKVESLKWEYLDIFEEVKSDVTFTVQYDYFI